MIVHQQSSQVGSPSDPELIMPSAAGHGAEMILEPPDNGTATYLELSRCSTVDISAHNFHARDNHYSMSQPLEPGNLAASCDAPMSFRDRHRFLDEVYNSYPDPDLISGKSLKHISRQVGLLMDEVQSWFEDEKIRRSKLLACQQKQPQQFANQFPPSPESSTTSGQYNTVTMTMSFQNSNSPGTTNMTQSASSPPAVASQPSTPAAKKERGTGASKRRVAAVPEWPSTESKRQKVSTEYPCPDCRKSFTPERWPEHIKRVHFPDFIWDCPKMNDRTGAKCASKPFFRPDNFATHLRGEHECDSLEISRLKADCKFKVENFYHTKCGFCDEPLQSRNESIDHIKDHLRRNSEKVNPLPDLGISLWKERCGSEHKLKRSVHYQINLDATQDDKDGDHEEDDDESPGKGNPDNFSPDNAQGPPRNDFQGNGDNGTQNDDSGFPDQDLSFDSFMQYQEHSATYIPSQISAQSSFGLEGLKLPFRSLRKLGTGGHGSVDEVVCSSSEETFARKSVATRRTKQTGASQMLHLKNELAVLKTLSHSHLVKLIGAYADDDHSHIIMTPVADQNLADYMRESIPGETELYLRWMGCLASAMTYLHEKQVQHLDVKPQNILVQGNNVLLADFGTAKSFFQSTLPEENKLALTPMYSAPETMLSGTQDYKTDIFSLGCVFSEILTRASGRSLHEFENFRSQSSQKSFHSTLPKTREWINSLRVAINQKGHIISHEILKMLSKQSSDRPTASNISIAFAKAGHCCPSCAPDTLDMDIEIQTQDVSEFELLGSQFDTATETSSSPSLFPLRSGSYPTPFYDLYGTKKTEKLFRNEVNELISTCPSYDYDKLTSYPSVNHGEQAELPLDYTEFPPIPTLFDDDYVQRESPWTYKQGPFLTPELLPRRSPYEHQSPMYWALPLSDSPASRASIYSHDSAYYSEETSEKQRCMYPDCGKIYKDLKAHMLTHQTERPEKCPIPTCDYHTKGFARKYDKNRHTLTHYKGTMVCGFCPGSGSSAEKSFNRADVFKRHLTSVHGVEQTPPNSRKKMSVISTKTLSDYASDATGKCSTCSSTFENAQDFYEHLDDCVLRIVGEGVESEQQGYRAVLPGASDHQNSNLSKPHNIHTASTRPPTKSTIKEEISDEDEAFHGSREESPFEDPGNQKSTNSDYFRETKPGNIKARSSRKDHLASWGSAGSNMLTKKRVLTVFNGSRCLDKDPIILDTDHKSGNYKGYVTDLDVQTLRRAEGFLDGTEDKGIWLTGIDENCVV